MAERHKVICPRCDSVVAIVPKEGLKFTDLRCSNCGVALRAPGPMEQATETAAETVKAVLRETEEKIEKTFRSS